MADSLNLEGRTNSSKGEHTGLKLAKDTKQVNVPKGFN